MTQPAPASPRRPLNKILSAALLFSLGCGVPSGAGTDVQPPGDLAISDKARITSAAPSADLKQTVLDNTQFGLSLYKEVVADPANAPLGNAFISPQSITTALSMAWAGAQNGTSSAMEKTLRVSLPADRFHRAMNDLDRQLESRGKGALAADGKAFRLQQANQIFAQAKFQLEKPFLDTLATEYGANTRLLDFIEKTEKSRVAINTWVEDKTEQRIKNLLPQGSVSSDTRLVLVNAIYFNAAWETPFTPANTGDGTFHSPTGDLTASFMHASELEVPSAVVNDTEVFSLPYDGKELSMLVMMPPAGQVEKFEQSLDAATLDGLVQALKPSSLSLSMPKFTVTGETVSLKKPLTKLGMGVAFSGDADFYGITKQDHLFIADVLHKTFVKVNEAGTEAAAATAVIFNRDSVAFNPRVVTVDRPFVFVIRDEATGAIVFMGRISTPKA